MAGIINNAMSYRGASLTGRGGQQFQTDDEGWRLDGSGARTGIRVDDSGTVFDKGVQSGYVDSSGTVVGGARPSDTNAVTRALDPNTETVQGQVKNLIDSDNPLMQQAATRGAQAANARGLVNTTMGVQAGQAALYDAALPIASADAEAYRTQGLANQQAENATNSARLGGQIERDLTAQKAQIEKDLLAADGEQKSRLLAQQAEVDKRLTQLKGSIDTGLQQLRGQQAMDVANVEASYRTLIQANDSAGKLYQQAVDAINKTLLNQDLPPDARQAAIDRQVELLKSGLNLIGAVSNLDLSSLLNFDSVTAAGADTQAAPNSPDNNSAPPEYSDAGAD